MKTITFFLAFLGSICLSYAQKTGIRFESDQGWEQIKNKAKAENKYIFVDAFATWCLPCKWMDEHVYTSDKVGTFMNDKFISIKVQIDSTGTDNAEVKNWYKDAQKMLKEYEIDVLPTYLFFDTNGRIVHKFNSAMSDTTFIKMASNALDSTKQYYKLLEIYKNDKLSYDQMRYFAKAAMQINEIQLANKVAETYINSYLFKLKEQDFFTKEHLLFISDFLNDTDSKSFKLFFQESDKINKVLGPDAAEYKVRTVIGKQYIPKTPVEKDWDSIESRVNKKFGKLGVEEVFGARMMYYFNLKDWKRFGKYYVLYFKTALKRPQFNVNGITWPLFENVSDPQVLKFACDVVMKYAIDKWYQNDWRSYDTYANLLYTTGQRDQAIKWEEKALKLSDNSKEIFETLERMKKLK